MIACIPPSKHLIVLCLNQRSANRKYMRQIPLRHFMTMFSIYLMSVSVWTCQKNTSSLFLLFQKFCWCKGNVWRWVFLAERDSVGRSPKRAGLHLHQRPLGFSLSLSSCLTTSSFQPSSSTLHSPIPISYLTCNNQSVEVVPIMTAMWARVSWYLSFILNFTIDV